jgi:hypothetical protein
MRFISKFKKSNSGPHRQLNVPVLGSSPVQMPTAPDVHVAVVPSNKMQLFPPGQDRSPAQVSTAPDAEEAVASSSEKTAGKLVDNKSYVRALQKNLQKQLGREVSVPGEGRFRKVARIAATNPYLLLGAATVGVGVAGVLTAGTAHLVLGAIGTGQLSSSGSTVIDRWKSRKQGTVYLDQSAVEYLVRKGPDLQVKVVQVVLSASPPGDAYITAQQLMDAEAKFDGNQRLSRTTLSRLVRILRSPYGRAGLALLSAGLFLIAVTVIPEYVRGPSLRVAVVVSAIGGILIATAAIEEFKDAFMGSSGLSSGHADNNHGS